MSETSDFTVEVRDRNFVRQGQIAPEYTDLKFIDVHNGVGSWELKLPAEHPRLADATAKGAGIIVTEHWMEGAVHKYRVFSGRMRTARLSQDATDPAGTWVISGVDDNIIAAATRVYPDPAHLADAQATAYWEMSGAAETVMKSAVSLNAGAGAIISRRYSWLSVPASTNLGLPVKCSSRFDVLGDLLTSLGTAGGLGWEFRQQNNGIVFGVYTPQDKSGAVRLDIRNGGLQSNELGFTAPSASEVLVLGQGQGEERTVLRVTSPSAAAEAAAWGLRWEQVKDQRNTDDPAELLQAGTEIITDQGATVNSLKVVPSGAPGMRLGRDWYRGDRITVVIDGQETSAIVTQVAVSISAAGVIRQATIGDPVGFNFEAKMASKVKDVEQRVGQVERLIGQGVNWPDISNIPPWLTAGQPANSGRGTAAQRDAYFGIPGTSTQRSALANLRATWFNTTKGWEEMYFAPTGTLGLTVPGVDATFAADWYPIAGLLPGADIRNHNATMDLVTNTPTLITSYTVGTLGYAHDVTVTSGTLVIQQSGRYKLKGSYVINVHATGGRLSQITKNSTTDTASSYLAYGPYHPGQIMSYDPINTDEVVADLQAGDVLRLWGYQNSGITQPLAKLTDAGAFGALGGFGNYFRVQYVEPPLK